jgi:hypothetical protein
MNHEGTKGTKNDEKRMGKIFKTMIPFIIPGVLAVNPVSFCFLGALGAFVVQMPFGEVTCG